MAREWVEKENRFKKVIRFKKLYIVRMDFLKKGLYFPLITFD